MLTDIKGTGNYQRDYDTGRACAMRVIRKLRERSVSPFYLGDISNGFSQRFGAIERGFMAEISLQLINSYSVRVENPT